MGGILTSSLPINHTTEPLPELSAALSELQKKLHFGGLVSPPGGLGYRLADGDWCEEVKSKHTVPTDIAAVTTSKDLRELLVVIDYCNSEALSIALIGDARELLASSPIHEASYRTLVSYSIAASSKFIRVRTESDTGHRRLHIGISTPATDVQRCLRKLGLCLPVSHCSPLSMRQSFLKEIRMVNVADRNCGYSAIYGTNLFQTFQHTGAIILGRPTGEGTSHSKYEISHVIYEVVLDLNELTDFYTRQELSDEACLQPQASTDGSFRFLIIQAGIFNEDKVRVLGLQLLSTAFSSGYLRCW